MNIVLQFVAVIVLLVCAYTFFLAFARQIRGISDQIDLLMKVRNVVLAIVYNPKHLLVFQQVDETNAVLHKALNELADASEKEIGEKASAAERANLVKVLRDKHRNFEKIAEKMIRYCT